MQLEDLTKPIHEICHNCHKEIIAWQDESGLIKYRCPRCGCVTVSKRISRMKRQLEITAPKGQVVI